MFAPIALIRRTKEFEVSLFFYTLFHKGYRIDTKVMLENRLTAQFFADLDITSNVTKNILWSQTRPIGYLLECSFLFG